MEGKHPLSCAMAQISAQSLFVHFVLLGSIASLLFLLLFFFKIPLMLQAEKPLQSSLPAPVSELAHTVSSPLLFLFPHPSCDCRLWEPQVLGLGI